MQYISEGSGKCTGNAATDKAACLAGTPEGTWTADRDTAGENALNCFLKTNELVMGAYSNVSNLNTLIQANHQGQIVVLAGVQDCDPTVYQ